MRYPVGHAKKKIFGRGLNTYSIHKNKQKYEFLLFYLNSRCQKMKSGFHENTQSMVNIREGWRNNKIAPFCV